MSSSQIGMEKSPKVTLVSYAEGEPFTSILKLIDNATANSEYSHAILWTRMDMQKDNWYLFFRDYFEALENIHDIQFRSKNGVHFGASMPFCGAFKPFLIFRAMQELDDGEWVHYVDASRHFDGSPEGWHILDFIDRLRDSNSPDGIWGQAMCNVKNKETWQVAEEEPSYFFGDNFATLRDLYPDVVSHDLKATPHITAANFVIKNNPENRVIVLEWLFLAFYHRGSFCVPGAPEETALSLVLMNRRKPVLSLCRHRNWYQSHFDPGHAAGSAYWNLQNFSYLSTEAFLASLSSGRYDLLKYKEDYREKFIR